MINLRKYLKNNRARIRYLVIKPTLLLLYKILNKLVPIDKYAIYVPTNLYDVQSGYDIINYSSDNALSFVNYMFRQENVKKYSFYIEVYDFSKIDLFDKYVKSINPNIKIIYLSYNNKNSFEISFRNVFSFFQCKYFLSSYLYYDIRFKTKNQVSICLNYFTPFKEDFNLDVPWLKYADKSIDYYVCTSKLASQITSISTGINYSKFLTLGFPRNDSVLSNSKKNIFFEYIRSKTSFDFEKIVLYTPTYRDYEVHTMNERNIFGYKGNLEILTSFLRKNKVLLIVKLHNLQNTKKLLANNLETEIILFEKNEYLGLYDIIPNADLLITDYTSTYFDFLILNRPVVFNFYDKEIYAKARGFSYDPIEFFCAGSIVETEAELTRELSRNLFEMDNFSDKRLMINNIMNKHKDLNSSQRIFDCIF